jgi:hypothetical protein
MKLLAIAALSSALLSQAPAPSLRSEVETSNRVFERIMLARDGKAFRRYVKAGVTPDFKHVENGQSMNADQTCAMMEAGIRQYKKMTKATSKIVSVKESGNKGTAVIEHHTEGTVAGPDGKAHSMVFTGTVTNTYVKQGGRWKMSRMVWGKSTMKMDGKPMRM